MTISNIKTIASVAVDTTLADAAAINIDTFSAGSFTVDAASTTLTTITWWINNEATANFRAAYDGASAVQSTGLEENRAYPIPALLFGAKSIKGVGNADAVIHVFLKG